MRKTTTLALMLCLVFSGAFCFVRGEAGIVEKNTGSYVVTFTLPDGDEYYGEFEVTE